MHKGHAVWDSVYIQCKTFLDQFWALFVRAQLICHTMKSGTMKYQCHEIQSYRNEKYKIHEQYNYTSCISSHRFDSNLDVYLWSSACKLSVSDLITVSGNLASEVRGACRHSKLRVTAYLRCPVNLFWPPGSVQGGFRSPLYPTCLSWIVQVISSLIMCLP